MSMFCVTTARTSPRRSSSASARCAAFGRGISEVFVREGARLAILDRNAEVGARAAQELGALFVEADVADEPSVERAVARVADELGRPAVLVNNAAIFILKSAEEATPDE